MSSEELYYHIPGGYVNGIHYVFGQRIPVSLVENGSVYIPPVYINTTPLDAINRMTSGTFHKVKSDGSIDVGLNKIYPEPKKNNW